MESPHLSDQSSCALRQLALAALLAGCGACLEAQTAPTDAGRILRDEQGRNRVPAPPAQSAVPFNIELPTTAQTAPGGPKLLVTAFRFKGNSVISSDLLETALVDGRGRELDLAGLRALADRVTLIYRAEGYPFSQAFLPKQEVKDGVVLIEIVEGRYGVVTVSGEHGAGEAVQPFLADLRSGELISERRLEHAILVATEIPGVMVAPVFSPGSKPGESDLNLSAKLSESWHGSVKVDNFGLRYSGAYRLQVGVERAGLFRIGDKTSLNLIATNENLLLGGVKYDFPINGSGLRGYVGYSRTDYQLGAGFEGFTGLADSWSAGLSYPLVRSQRANLSLVFGAEYKLLTDAHLGVTYESRDELVASGGLLFDQRDTVLGGGLTYGEVKVSAGNVSSNVANSIQGDFTKLNAQVARLQNAAGPFGLYGSLSAQVSDRRLNAVESFSLGGATGIRSYPNGEAQGTSGALAQLELRYEAGSVTPYLFCDQGEIFAQHGLPSRSLGGVGLGARYRAGSLSAEAACAWKTNGGASTSDSHQQDPRLWVGLGYRY